MTSIKNRIIDSLKRDIPVTLAYGIGGKFNLRDWEDLSTIADGRITGGHYINVTEFVIDKITQDKYMRIATWGERLYIEPKQIFEGHGIGGALFFYET